MICVASAYFEPVLSFRIYEFTDSVNIQGVVFSANAIGFALTAIAIQLLIKDTNSITMIVIGLLTSGLSNFLIGPSYLLPNNLILIIMGLFVSGITMAFFRVPIIPIMLKRVEARFPLSKRKASDLVSTMYNLTFSIGQFCGPIYGGYLTDMIGYRNC